MSPTSPYGSEDFARELNVSRETMELLERYETLLRKWQTRINLVGKSTLDDLWRRHFLDSAQLVALAPNDARIWTDMGSGAGFPGLVVAVMLRDRPGADFNLIESDSRKCAFLRTVVQALGLPVRVHGERIGEVTPGKADVVTARALAPLTTLLEMGLPHRTENGLFLFPKGQDVDKELTDATKSWIIDADRIQSQSDNAGVILRIKEVKIGLS